MAYQDPYSQNYNYNNAGYAEQPYNQPTYPPYDPAASSSSRPALHQHSSSMTTGVEKRWTQASFREPPKDTGDLRLWRHDNRGNLWTKGSRGSCIGRFFCFLVLSFLFILLSIAFAIAMWLRPPDVSFGGIGPPTNGSTIEASASSLKLNFALPISVANPNFFTASFEQIKATAYYPGSTVGMGGGSRDNIAFPSNSKTTFNFPFSIEYDQTKDPNSVILLDIANRCGFTGNPKKQIIVNYAITLQIRILAFSISPSFNGATGFDCPLTEAQIKPFLGGLLGGSGS